MAQPVPFRRYIPADTKDDVERKIEQAPVEHADAVLSGYALLQQLHDTGTLDLLRGMLGAGDAVVNHVVDIVSNPEMVKLLRSGLALGTLLSNVNPDEIHAAIEGRPEDRNKKPSLFRVLRQLRSEEAMIGLSVAASLLTVLGGAVKKQRAAASSAE